MSNLVKSVSKGAVWSLLDIVFNKASYFLVLLYLARVLGPEEFGIMGMIVVFVNMGNALVDSGMSTSILRMKNPDEDDYSTVFLANLLISVCVYLVLFFLAPLISDFYNEPVLVRVVRLYTLGFIIYAFKAIHITKLSKELNFKKIAILSIPGILVSSVLAIWMANNGYGVFSLVGLFLTNQFISCLFFNLLNKRFLKIRFTKDKWIYHFNFGYKLMLSAQINILFDNIYNVWIGKGYTKRELGFFERSQTFNSYPSQVVVELLSKVSLPAFASVKDDQQRVELAYKKVMMMAFFIMCSIMSIGAGLAEPLFGLILGETWLPAVEFFRILALAYILFPIHSLNINLLSLFDRSDLFLKLEIAKKIITVASLALGYFFGVEGLLWSIVLSSYVGLFINAFYSGKFINYSFLTQVKDMLPIFIMALGVYGTLHFLQLHFALSDVWSIVIFGLLGCFIILVFSWLTHRKPFFDLLNIFKILLSK